MLGFFPPLYVDTSRRTWVGTSQQRVFTKPATVKNRAAGTSIANRQDRSSSIPAERIGITRHHMMKICVTPPPRLPQPAAVAFAVPTTFGANISEHQNWFVTNVAPAHPIIMRIKMKFHSAKMPAAASTQTEPKVRRPDCTLTGPKRSNRVPSATRTKTVLTTEKMLE